LTFVENWHKALLDMNVTCPGFEHPAGLRAVDALDIYDSLVANAGLVRIVSAHDMLIADAGTANLASCRGEITVGRDYRIAVPWIDRPHGLGAWTSSGSTSWARVRLDLPTVSFRS